MDVEVLVRRPTREEKEEAIFSNILCIMSLETLMSAKTDEQLLKIVTGPADEDQPEAFEAAKQELVKRDVAFEQMQTAFVSNENEQRLKLQKATEPFDNTDKLLCFILLSLLVSRPTKHHFN